MTGTTATRRINAAWIVASGLTLVSWGLALTRSGGHLESSAPEALSVLALGAVKARLVMQEFMEVRTAPRWLRHLTDVWLAALWLTVLVLYLT